MSKSVAASMASHMKQVAKELSKEVPNLSHAQYVDRLTSALFKLGAGDLLNALRAEDLAYRVSDGCEILDCPPNTAIVYQVRLAGSQWSLRIANDGPKLHLDYRPCGLPSDEKAVSDLGAFQSLQRNKDCHRDSKLPPDAWVVTRHGQHPKHSLEFMSNEEVQALSRHFGIPFYKDTNVRKQQERSEAAFLRSHSFNGLRKALRLNKFPLPRLDDWRCGLSPLWGQLVALSDKQFVVVNQVIENYYRCKKFDAIRKANDQLKNSWRHIPSLGKTGEGIDTGILEILRLNK